MKSPGSQSIELPPLITIPAGPFLMGTPDVERSTLAKRYGGTRASYEEESPQHTVSLPEFAIAAVPVTNGLYATFVAATEVRAPLGWPARQPPPGLESHPVVDIRWDEAISFCHWLAGQTNQAWRLPTEAEWEKAARGTDGRTFPWGEDTSLPHANIRESGALTTTPVGCFRSGASPYGVLDMAGNVWEWTQSLQRSYPYVADDGRNTAALDGRPERPRWWPHLRRDGAPPDARRILRGGCYANPLGFARCACRLRLLPTQSTPFLGLRLALSLTALANHA